MSIMHYLSFPPCIYRNDFVATNQRRKPSAIYGFAALTWPLIQILGLPLDNLWMMCCCTAHKNTVLYYLLTTNHSNLRDDEVILYCSTARLIPLLFDLIPISFVFVVFLQCGFFSFYLNYWKSAPFFES